MPGENFFRCLDETSGGLPISDSPPFVIRFQFTALCMCVRLLSEANNRKIETFDISIQPYEDCCTIFTPPHPKIRPELAEILEAEAAMPGLAELEAEAASPIR